MKQYNYIYKITNTVNGKIYIGKHSTDRMDDGYMGSGHRLHLAYTKYGQECFRKEVILFYTSEEELNQGEIYWIAKFNSTDLTIGYNLTYGGEGEIPTEEVRRKMSEAHKGVPRSEETRRKISEGQKGKRIGENNPMYGKTPWNKDKKGCYNISDETKQKLSEATKLYWQRRKLAKLNQQNNG